MPSSATRIEYGKKRVGKPRQTWIHHAKKFVWEETLGRISYEETPVQENLIYNAGLQHSSKASAEGKPPFCCANAVS